MNERGGYMFLAMKKENIKKVDRIMLGVIAVGLVNGILLTIYNYA